MNTDNIPYSKRNNIRTKLLLYIDNEIHIKIKNKLLPEINIDKINSASQIIINFEETYTQSSNEDISKKKSTSTNDDSPKRVKILDEKIKRASTHAGTVKQQLANNIYSINSFNKRAFFISPIKKEIISPKNGKKFLKKLCENLKRTEKLERNNYRNSNRTIITLRKIQIDDYENKKMNKNKVKNKSNSLVNFKIKKEKKKEEKKQVYSLFRKMKQNNKKENS